MRNTSLDLRGGHHRERPLSTRDTWKPLTLQATFGFECIPSDLPGALPKAFEVLMQQEMSEESTLR